MLEKLIDKFDGFEIIRDQIAAIIKTESVNQEALAVAAGKDPELWKLRVFTERSNPWEEWLNNVTDKSPIINVWFDNSNFNRAAGNVVERQTSDTIYNIDCLGLGVSKDDGGGHIPGDREAIFVVQRAIRLVRNILMAAENTYLQLRGTVGSRWPQSIVAFQPELNGRQGQQVAGARIRLEVAFNEFSPQFEGAPFESILATVKQTDSGEILMEAEYDF